MIEPTGLKAGQWVWLLDIRLTRCGPPALLVARQHDGQGWITKSQGDIRSYRWPAEYLEPASLEDVARSQLAGLEGL